MKVQFRVLGLLLAAGCYCESRADGALAGTVLDSLSGEPVGGATVRMSGSGRSADCDGKGRFLIPGQPAGTDTAVISGLGYRTYRQVVQVEDGRTASARVRLANDYMELPGLTVTAQRQGQSLALNLQKNSDNIKNVIASDFIGRFPDQNGAEAMQRLPGVAVERDQGEGRYVLIRGTEPRLTSAKINGMEVPSPEGDIRNVALDVIPSDQLAFIEVNKSLTPDMDGDGIGGSINLLTPVARDARPRLKVTLAGGFNPELASVRTFQGSFAFDRRFLPDARLGLAVAASHFTRGLGSDNNEMEWGEEDVQGDDALVLKGLDLRDYEIVRDRSAMTTTLDYRFSPSSQIMAQAMFNRFGDREHRRRLTYAFDAGDYQTDHSSEGAEVTRQLKDRYEVQDIFSTTVGGNHLLGKLGIEYGAGYSFSREREPNGQDITFVQEDVDLSYSGKAPSNFPRPTAAGGDPFDPDAFLLDEVLRYDNMTTDQNVSGRLDLSFPLPWKEISLKAGGKVRRKEKDRDAEGRPYGWDGAGDAPTMAEVNGGLVDDDFLGGRYRVGSSPDPDRSRKFFSSYRDSLEEDADGTREESDPATYEASEDLMAGYGQGRIRLGRFHLLMGARYEATRYEYRGNEVVFDENGDYLSTSPLQDDGDYGHFLPMAHLRYEVTPKTNLRTSLTRSLARPNYYDLVPYRIVNREDEEVELGNPDLNPTTAWNVDLMAEHYFQNLGSVSAGFFYKWIEDLIYASTSELDGSLGASLEGYQATRPMNGRWGELYGIEAGWGRQLSFLPGFLNGLGLYANYTFTWSEASVPGRGNLSFMPGQSEQLSNLSVSYEKHGFSGRLSANFYGRYLLEVGETASEDIYRDNHFQLDLAASQRIIRNLRFFFEASNLTNEPFRVYQGSKHRPIQQEYYSWWNHAGFKYEF